MKLVWKFDSLLSHQVKIPNCFVPGCKIKALRAKTNTYIKTPVRGEEPVFVVTGRKEDVTAAKREILSAADHFSQIRASRKNNINSTLALGQLMANTPGQTTVQVRVPYRVVGLVIILFFYKTWVSGSIDFSVNTVGIWIANIQITNLSEFGIQMVANWMVRTFW